MKVTQDRRYRLGLDLGTNSIGWAAVNLDDQGQPCGVLDMGVRIFPNGRHPKSNVPYAADRRIARGQRRRLDRYLMRRDELMQALIEYGLMPSDPEAREDLQRLDSYSLRARGLDQPLSPFELGRALFHLNQRRGFKSNRKSGGEKEDEKNKTADAIDGLRRRMKESGARTLGEFQSRRHAQKESVRFREGSEFYPDRAMYEEEFDTIRQKQTNHHKLSPEQWDSLHEIIFYQRPLQPVEPGWCQFEFENEKRRAAKALPIFQEFRILQEVNNLRVQIGSEQDRPLNEVERERVLQRLRSGQNINFANPNTGLRLDSWNAGVSFNLAYDGRKKIQRDETTARLSKKEYFGNRWHSLSLQERNEVVEFLLTTERELVHQKAVEEWGLSEPQANAVANVSLPTGYGNLSEKAIRKILPHLERGSLYSDAVKEAGYSHHSDFRRDTARDCLPYYGEILPRDVVGANLRKDPLKDGEESRYGRVPNPTVHIALNQLRRVVNCLIEVYGKPENIVVELVRDLKLNDEQRKRHKNQQKENEKQNQKRTKMLEDAGLKPTRILRDRLRLWEEQGPVQARVCPYTGRNLSFEMVVSSQTNVEHILPFSRTWDDSMANKVVCIAAANHAKGNRSPYEAFGHSPPGYDYQEILDRTNEFPWNKRGRFREDAMDQFESEGGFLARQLNDTAYFSKIACGYLACLYNEKGEGRKRVWATRGYQTGGLRKAWGLEGILRADADTGEIVRKQRDDHRHHAIDAFVVANTTQGLLQRFARAVDVYPHVNAERVRSLTPPPWDGFHGEQLRPYLDSIIVSHKPDHGTRGVQGKTSGKLHNETAYGIVEPSEDEPYNAVHRIELSKITKPQLDRVRDQYLCEALKKLWEKTESEVETAGGKASEVLGRFSERAASEGVLLGGRRQIVRRVRVLENVNGPQIKDRDGKPYKMYKSDGNEFANVWRMSDGDWKIVVVPTFDANQPDFDPEKFRPVDKSGRKDPMAKLLGRLHTNDMVAIGEGEDRRIMRVRKMSAGRIGLDDHNEAKAKPREYRAKTLRDSGFRKVGVDEIGRVSDPGPTKL